MPPLDVVQCAASDSRRPIDGTLTCVQQCPLSCGQLCLSQLDTGPVYFRDRHSWAATFGRRLRLSQTRKQAHWDSSKAWAELMAWAELKVVLGATGLNLIRVPSNAASVGECRLIDGTPTCVQQCQVLLVVTCM